MHAVDVATLNANSVNKKKDKRDWQYLGVGKFTLGLVWNCGRKARKGHICEDTFAYGSYSSKDIERYLLCDFQLNFPSVGAVKITWQYLQFVKYNCTWF